MSEENKEKQRPTMTSATSKPSSMIATNNKPINNEVKILTESTLTREAGLCSDTPKKQVKEADKQNNSK